MPRFHVTTIGEGQLRYSVETGRSLIDAPHFDVHVSGTEGNVTSWLSQFGWKCGWVSSLPRNPLGQRVIRSYEACGVDTSAVVWTDQYRLATYYVEFGVPPKGTHVHYDRSGTAFVNLTPAQIDWEYLLDTRLIHLSGLSVPLSPSVHEIIITLMQRAKQRGIPVSFDMNYRSRIWSAASAAATITPLLQHVDILFLSRSDARLMYGCEGDGETVVRQIAERTATSACLIVTSLSEEGLIGWDRTQFYYEPAHRISVIDRIGAGDAMVAGVLHGWLQGDFTKAVRYGTLTSAVALTHYGDRTFLTAEQLETLLTTPNRDILR